jgi:hypothetical protein
VPNLTRSIKEASAMKKFFILLTLAAFMIAVPLAMADQPGATKSSADQPTVNCCVKGKCNKAASEAACTKEGGKVVKECKDCK